MMGRHVRAKLDDELKRTLTTNGYAVGTYMIDQYPRERRGRVVRDVGWTYEQYKSDMSALRSEEERLGWAPFLLPELGV